MGWGVPPNIVPETDTSQLLALIVAQRVLEDAARGVDGGVDALDRSRISVILGVTSGQELLGDMVSRLQKPVWLKSLRESGIPEEEAQAVCDRIASHYTPWRESTFPGLLGNVVAGRIANRLDLGGTNCVTDAACASTFSALAMGVQELQLGDSDLVISGGVDTMNDIFMFMCFSKTPALSATGDCRPFSASADGTMLGEGLGMVALKRLADAERDGDKIYAVLNSVGTSSDGRAKSVYAPRPEGQAEALRRAYRLVDYGPDTVELVEAHGTGTIAGDAAEFGGLAMAFDEAGRADRQWCALGSVKSQIGHTKAAAGAAGLFKAVMALHHKVLPPSIKIDKPNPKMDLENSAFHLATRSRPWVRSSDHPRRASVSSFGFGGSNFHVTLSEYEPDSRQATTADVAPRLATFSDQLVPLHAVDVAGLLQAARELATTAESARSGFTQFTARQHQRAFTAALNSGSDCKFRLAVLAESRSDLAAKLRKAADLIEAAPTKPLALPMGIHFGFGATVAAEETALLFPGQGSQYLDMGGALAMHFGRALQPWDLAADLGLNLWKAEQGLHQVVFPPTAFTDADAKLQEDRLNATQWAQPAIAAVSLSMLGLLENLGVRAGQAAGHSFGEITALHASGAISGEDCLRIARRRGELMAEAATVPGAMLAVASTLSEVEQRLQRWGVDLVVANHNAPRQVVLSGTLAEIEKAEKLLAEEGVTQRRLPVATAFHSKVVAGASAALGEFLKEIEFKAPQLEAYSNSSAQAHSKDPAQIREALAAQLSNPVRFVDMIENMYAAGARTFIEVGPGSIQTGLVGQILDQRSHVAVSLDRKGKDGLRSFFAALASLAVAGLPLNFDALWSEYEEPVDPATRPQPKLSIPINGANHGKPYPPRGGAKDLPPPNPPRAVATPAVAVAAASSVSTTASPGHGSASAAPAAVASVVSSSPTASGGFDATRMAPAVAPTPPAIAVGAGLAPGLTSAPLQAAPAQLQGQVVANSAWGCAQLEAQRQTAQAHQVYLQSMASTHSAFLDAVGRSLSATAAVSTGVAAQSFVTANPGAPAQAIGAFAAAPAALPAQVFANDAHTAAPSAVEVVPAQLPASAAAAALDAPAPAAPTTPSVNREAFAAAKNIAAAFDGSATGTGLFVTVQDTGGAFATTSFDSTRAWLSGCAALTRTVAQEWKQVAAKAIDLQRAARSSEDLAEILAEEIVTGGPDLDVGLTSDGKRRILRSREEQVDQGKAALSDGDLVVCTGGARGVTAATMLGMAARQKLKFALLGRTRLEQEPSCCVGVEGDAGLKKALLADAVARGEKPKPAELGARVSAILASREVQ